jgi:hypothetical protein
MKTKDTPLFDHSPGEESNRLALEQVREKENYHDTVEKISSHELKNEKTKNLSSVAKIMIIICGLAFFVFVIGDAAFSWDVFEDKVASKINLATSDGETTDQKTKTIVIIVIAAFAGVALIGSNMLKQPWTKNIPSLDFNKKEADGPGVYSGRTQSLSRFKPIPKRDNSVWIWFIVGALLTSGTGYVLYKMSVEREQFHGEIQAYSENNKDNSQFEGYDLTNISKDKNMVENPTNKKMPVSVWLPLLFYVAECATGWALIPMFLIFSFWFQTNSLTSKKERHKQQSTVLFNDVITIYPSYVADIEDYNNSYEVRERPLTPNPELKEILHIYDNNGNALTRVTRKDNIQMDIDHGKGKEEAKDEPEKPITIDDSTQKPNLKEEAATDYDFFDKESII